MSSPIYYPNVSRIPSNPAVSDAKKPAGGEALKKGEFDQQLQSAIQQGALQKSHSPEGVKPELANVSQGLKFSAHATQRLRERQIHFDPETMSRMNDAISQADSKGVQDTLVLTDKAALIVSVPNRTVITAMDRNNLSGNVFTNIDGAVIV